MADDRVPTGLSAATILRFPGNQLESYPAQMVHPFMDWVMRANAAPGTLINEDELARQCGVTVILIRELLERFHRFHLLDRCGEGIWVLKRVSQEYALELCDIRELFELRSARLFSVLPEDSPMWAQVEAMRDAHLKLLDDFQGHFQDFPKLDSRFHRLISAVAPNRFMDSFYDVITLVFHYHYQWNKCDECQRNHIATLEHIAYIDALVTRNIARIETASRGHMASARQSMLRSIAA
jgi:DNA-binding GntR family transcriptional regulator